MAKVEREKLGIPTTEKDYIKIVDSPMYYEPIRKGLNPRDIEYQVYQSVSKKVAEWFEEMYLQTGEKADIQFINYGDTELVYVIGYGDKKYTMLIGQPSVARGKIKQEAELLKKYAAIDRATVVAPLAYYPVISPYNNEKKDYFRSFYKEAYITPYHMQARCVASQEDGFGIYVPEPNYHFEKFSKAESDLVCSCMIAKLVYMYDAKTKAGISACKLGGGDFILSKEWDREHLDAVDTLKNMKLIAAREEVHCTLDDYISLLKSEFSKKTYYATESARDKSILVNHKARVGMNPEAIDKGIAVGLKLREIANKKRIEKGAAASKSSTSAKKQTTLGVGKKS